MAIERINPADVYEPNRNIYTQVIRATGAVHVHVAGIVPWDVDKKLIGPGDMAAQVACILHNIERALASVRASRSNVVRINVYTVDIDRYIRQGTPVLKEFFGDAKPVSTTVEVSRLVHPDWLVEIEATAIID
jgi:enamine deaminase RidA (YjgF/YER057c/UK114 family)